MHCNPMCSVLTQVARRDLAAYQDSKVSCPTEVRRLASRSESLTEQTDMVVVNVTKAPKSYVYQVAKAIQTQATPLSQSSSSKNA